MAKKFFYVCSGVLCLALAYQFGAGAATAQSGRILVGVDLLGGAHGCSVMMAVDNLGTVYADCGYMGTYMPVGHLTGTPAGITSLGNELWIPMQNGDVYRSIADQYPSFNFTYMGNVFGAPTSLSQTTWGQVKDRYRK